MIRALFLAAALLPSPARAAEPAAEVPPIPSRFELPKLESPRPARVLPEGLSEASLQAVLRDPKAPAVSRMDALERLIPASKFTKYGEDPDAFYRALESCAALEDAAFSLEPGPFRRHAVSSTFPGCAADARGAAELHPDDPRWEPAWRRWDALVRRGLKDPDPALAEFFERYDQPSPLPDWKAVKARTIEALGRLKAAHPGDAAFFDQVRDLGLSIESSQLTVGRRMLPSKRFKGRLRPKDLAFADEAVMSTPRLRCYDVWVNMVPRTVEERYGAAEAARHGIAPAPIRLGWPDFRPLFGASERTAGSKR